jgi:hypothetical protein
MNKNTITVAGESLEALETALDHFDIEFEACGRVNMTGALPPHLAKVLERALKTIEAEIAACDDDVAFDNGEMYPMRQLLLRIGAAYAEHG